MKLRQPRSVAGNVTPGRGVPRDVPAGNFKFLIPEKEKTGLEIGRASNGLIG